jgi:hypothetical protein
MAKMLLDHLLEIEKLTPAKARDYAMGLYVANRHFADYADLCYNRAWASRWYGKRVPNFKVDGVPYGYHFTQLERTVNKFRAGGFTSTVNPETDISEEKAFKLLTQVMEGISDVEQKFLKQILRGKIPYFTLENWKEVRKV